MPRTSSAVSPGERRLDRRGGHRRAVGTLVALMALLGASLPTTAFADTRVPLTGGALDWRINDNMRFQGSWAQISTVADGAERLTVDPMFVGGVAVDLDVFRFPVSEGSTYAPVTGDATIGFDGAVTVGNSDRGDYTMTLSGMTLDVVDGIATLGATVAGQTAPGTFGGVSIPGGPFGPTRVDAISVFDATVTTSGGAVVLDGAPRHDVGPSGLARGFSTAFVGALPSALSSWFQVTGDDPATTTNVRKLTSPITVQLVPAEEPAPPEDGGGEEPAPAPEDGGGEEETTPTPRQVTATSSAPQVAPGGAVTVSAGGFVPDETLRIELRSDPVELGTTQADSDGEARADVTIPADTPPGTHTIALIGAEQEATVTLLIAAPAGGQVTDGALDWGVKASFRNYILGPIANGTIEASAGADSIGGLFRFAATGGNYDSDGGTLDATFAGTVRFSGHVVGGSPLLDLAVSDPRVVLGPDGGTLFLDVESLPLSGDERLVASDVAFAELDLPAGVPAPVDGVLTLTDVPATLTEAGAEAFAGFYVAGEDLDPLTIILAIDDAEVALPTLPEDTSGGGGPIAVGVGDRVTAPASPAVPATLPATGATELALAALAALLLASGALMLRTVPARQARRSSTS
jgi:hypothetical protein